MVSHVISEHTSLLYGRHLDQIMLCALYGVCKVNQLKQITFKDIITQYKKQAQAKNSIFRTVAIQLTPGLQVGVLVLTSPLKLHNHRGIFVLCVVGFSICKAFSLLLMDILTC